ncbi:hypothetical protein MNBD_GAMMA12-2289 [hydrothermal vent metagenome]|uniref:Uncharacterized protein n=1 Tax=hydrothermal vent metagenome TaxID=652676 RepID=A0A3B0YBR2_9ZZZZ
MGGIAVTGGSSINRKTAKQGSYTIYFRDQDGYVVRYHGRRSFARMAKSAAFQSRRFDSKVIDFNWTANDGRTRAQNIKNSKKDEAARIWAHDAGPQLNLDNGRTAELKGNTVNVNIYGGQEPTGRNYNGVFTAIKYLYWAGEAIRNPASIQGWPLSVSKPSPDGHPSYDPKSKAQRDRMATKSKTY